MVDAKKIEELRGLLAADTSTDWQTVRTDPAEGADVWWLCAKNSAGQEIELGLLQGGFPHPTREARARLICAMRNALPALLDLAPKALATLSLAGEDARPEDRAEQFIQAAVDSAPEPLRRLGEWLANKLDDDDWKTAERLLNGASVEARSLSLRVEAEKRERERLKDRIDLRMNDYLVEMREGYDDSITGFNEAWDIVRSVFADMESNNAGK